jgi:ABC-type multidrug transport system fused ATPase/permease subunit
MRSPGRLLWWLVRIQTRTVVGGAALGIVWMAARVVVLPAVLGAGIDEGVAGDDRAALLGWSAALLAVGVLIAGTGMFRHRSAITSWLAAASAVQQLVARRAAEVGAAMPRRVATGEVISVGTTDIQHLGEAMNVITRFAGAVVSFVVVAAVLTSIALPLGMVVIVGVPLLGLCLGPLLRPLHHRQAEQRERVGAMGALGADTVAGLRVLRGIGGEELFRRRYAAASEQVRRYGVRVAGVRSTVEALEVLLPGAFMVTVVWLATRLAVDGRLSIGTVVACYGYAAFLVIPLQVLSEAADKWTRAFVSARRCVALLSVSPDPPEPADPAPEPPADAELVDEVTGLRAARGELTAVVCTEPGSAAALAERLGGYQPGAALGGVRLVDLPRAAVRRRVHVSEHEPQLFSGRLRADVDPAGRHTPDELSAALAAGAATDIVDGLPNGWDSQVTERGRSLSGGQRQRIALVRALLTEPDVLVVDDPTSAVDAHTEALVAEGLAAHRRGRTTVVLTTSPQLLGRADRVALVSGGTVRAAGSHAELGKRADYREVVARG